MVWLELGFILILLLVNGLLALSELALVSSRRLRLEALATQGVRGARSALKLMDHPGRFLSAVQIGITLVGVLAGAVGGATLAGRLAGVLEGVAWLAPHSEALAYLVVVLGTTYAALVVGELVPKQLALRAPEELAARVAPGMQLLSRLTGPAVSLLDRSAALLLGLLGSHRVAPPTVTEEEVRAVIAEGARSGVLLAAERELISGVMRVADWTIEPLATPRADVVWLDLDAGEAAHLEVLAQAAHSRLLVGRGSLDEVLGVVEVEDLLAQRLAGGRLDPAAVMHPPLVLRTTTPALQALEALRQAGSHFAVVLENGERLYGILTAMDILSAMSASLAEPAVGESPPVVQRPDGSWLVDGELPIDRVADAVGLPVLSGRRDFHTLAGLVLWQLERLPVPGDTVEFAGFRLEVVDMDGPRVDKILVSRLAEEEGHG